MNTTHKDPGPRGVSIPAEVLVEAGIAAGDDLVMQATADGIHIASDRLRKVYVEATSHCNLDCPMCVRHGRQEPVGHMPVDRFERLVAGLGRAEGRGAPVAFGGFGEPLVHPEWSRLLRIASTAGCRIEITTNGLLVDDDAAAAIVGAPVSQVTVSVDGGDAAIYSPMRGIGSEGALAAVRRLLDARLHTRRPLSIGVAAVATRSTVGSLPRLIEWASALKLDFISIGNLVPHTQEMAHEILWDHTGWASVFRPASWRPQIRAGRFDVDDDTRALAAALALGGLTYPSPSCDYDATWRNRCRFVLEGMCAVGWDGRVAPCLSLLYTHNEHINGQERRVREYVVGHVDQQPLSAIWRAADFKAFRARVRAFDFPPCFHCGGCPLTETNEQDCYGNPAPVCGECLWAQGIVLCP